MTEILIQLELMTIIYFCILAFVIPVLGFCGYRIGNLIFNVILVKTNSNVTSSIKCVPLIEDNPIQVGLCVFRDENIVRETFKNTNGENEPVWVSLVDIIQAFKKIYGPLTIKDISDKFIKIKDLHKLQSELEKDYSEYNIGVMDNLGLSKELLTRKIFVDDEKKTVYFVMTFLEMDMIRNMGK